MWWRMELGGEEDGITLLEAKDMAEGKAVDVREGEITTSDGVHGGGLNLCKVEQREDSEKWEARAKAMQLAGRSRL